MKKARRKKSSLWSYKSLWDWSVIVSQGLVFDYIIFGNWTPVMSCQCHNLLALFQLVASASQIGPSASHIVCDRSWFCTHCIPYPLHHGLYYNSPVRWRQRATIRCNRSPLMTTGRIFTSKQLLINVIIGIRPCHCYSLVSMVGVNKVGKCIRK